MFSKTSNVPWVSPTRIKCGWFGICEPPFNSTGFMVPKDCSEKSSGSFPLMSLGKLLMKSSKVAPGTRIFSTFCYALMSRVPSSTTFATRSYGISYLQTTVGV